MTAITWVLAAVPCYGQVRAVDGQSAEAQRIMVEQCAYAANAEKDWRDSKKLTLLDEIPESSHGQSECLSPSDLKDGSVGYLDYWHTEVIQVLGQTDVLLMVANNRNPPVLLKDYPTKGLVDGEKVRLLGLVQVDGTKSYTTVDGGQKTVRVVCLVSREQLLKMQAEAEAALFRTWTDTSGTHEIIAKFLDFRNGKVRLERKDDHKQIEIANSRLSKEDQRWVRNELKSRKEKERRGQ